MVYNSNIEQVFGRKENDFITDFYNNFRNRNGGCPLLVLLPRRPFNSLWKKDYRKYSPPQTACGAHLLFPRKNVKKHFCYIKKTGCSLSGRSVFLIYNIIYKPSLILNFGGNFMKCLVITKKQLMTALCLVCTLILTVAGSISVFANSDRLLPIYCVETDKKQIAISFDVAWCNNKKVQNNIW